MDTDHNNHGPAKAETRTNMPLKLERGQSYVEQRRGTA